MESIAKQVQARLQAAGRCEPLDDGSRDPDTARRLAARRPKCPGLVLAMLDTLPGAHITREEARAAWPLADARQRALLVAYFNTDDRGAAA